MPAGPTASGVRRSPTSVPGNGGLGATGPRRRGDGLAFPVVFPGGREGPTMTDAVPPAAEELLTGEPTIAHLATCADGRPHVAPVWFAYDDGTVEVLTTGRKLANLRENPRVALSVQKDVAGRTEWMVSLLGRASVVEDEAATEAATRRINRRYGAEEAAWSENVLVRIDVGSATYRRYRESR